MCEDAATRPLSSIAVGAFAESTNHLWLEVVNVLRQDAELRDEFLRLFPDQLETEPDPDEEQGLLGVARFRCGQIGAWIAGLVEFRTLEQRIRAEAEETARLRARQPPGFSAT